MHDGIKQSIQEISCFISRYIKELEPVLINIPIIGIPKISYWKPPQQGIVKVNFVSSYDMHANKSFTRVIIRNEWGLIMGTCTYPHSYVIDAFVEEARACEWVLWFAKELSFKAIQVEGDFLTNIKKLQPDLLDWLSLNPIITDIKQKGVFFSLRLPFTM